MRKKVENHESIYNINIPVNLSDFRMISGVGSSLTIKGLNLGIEDCVRLVYNRIILNSTISAHDIMPQNHWCFMSNGFLVYNIDNIKQDSLYKKKRKLR